MLLLYHVKCSNMQPNTVCDTELYFCTIFYAVYFFLLLCTYNITYIYFHA